MRWKKCAEMRINTEDLEKEKEKTENGSRTQADILYPADD